MNPLEKYAENINTKNVKGILDLFADEFIFDDRGGQDFGAKPLICTSKSELEPLWEGFFENIPDLHCKLIGTAYENVMYYDVYNSGRCLPCVGVCRTNYDGLITEYHVFVREDETNN